MDGIEISPQPEFDFDFLPDHFGSPEDFRDTALALRTFRLQALQIAPDAYASTYEIEIAFPEEVWLQRLGSQDVRHLMVSRKGPTASPEPESSEHCIDACSEQDWVAMVVIMAKEASEEPSAEKSPWTYNTSRPSGSPGVTSSQCSRKISATTTWYQLNGLFVHPSARRYGLAKQLVQKSLAYVEAEISHRALPSTRVGVLVDSWNTAARNLYIQCGFEIVSEDSYTVGGSARKALSLSTIITPCILET
ncbi:hypothetical protein MMC19_001131 [Ptychographa xylographoides]|nr:hypothetical protein [Ptychographa xylographoides]